MRLKYKILWFDDKPEWVESIEDDIREFIEGEYCLEYVKDLKVKADPQESQYKNYDLILVDLNLEDKITGDQLIKKIREVDIYTDVLFYSADGYSKIKEKAQELGLEGVYLSGREKDAFIEKVKKVIASTINKIQDLDNLRGLVMAEVSGLDNIMKDIISKYFVEKGNDDRTKDFRSHIVEDIEKSTKNKLEKCDCLKNCQHKWKTAEIKEIINSLDFDSSKKALAINIIIKKENIEYSPNHENFYEDYLEDVIRMRNNLAHCTSESTDGNEVLKLKTGNIVFDSDKFKQIRKNIQNYNKLLGRIASKI